MGEYKISYLLYADGLILLSESEHGLKRCLDKLNCYAKKWQMRINIKKTKAIIFNKSGKIFRSEFKLGNQPIQVTDSYVYLGITFTPSGSFSLAQKKLYNNATRSLYSFLSEVNIYNGASVSTVVKLFDSLVSPILFFNCEIWGCFLKSVGNNYDKFVSRITPENMHNKVCKMASFLKQFSKPHIFSSYYTKTSDVDLYGTSGSYNLSTRINGSHVFSSNVF